MSRTVPGSIRRKLGWELAHLGREPPAPRWSDWGDEAWRSLAPCDRVTDADPGTFALLGNRVQEFHTEVLTHAQQVNASRQGLVPWGIIKVTFVAPLSGSG